MAGDAMLVEDGFDLGAEVDFFFIPKKEECTNLLVPVCVSSTHTAFGSIRMEPVFMILGQSAAAAASLAIDENIAVQDLDYADLRKVLLEQKQVLENQ